MIKWFKSLPKQEKLMLLLIVVLFIGIILRWDTIRKRALIWFKYDDIMEERAAKDSLDELRRKLPDTTTEAIETETIIIDTLH